MQRSVAAGWRRCLSPLTLDFTCPERHMRHLQITGLCKIPQKLSLVTFDLMHCKFPVSLCGGLTGGWVFIDHGVLSCCWEGRLQRSSVVYYLQCFVSSALTSEPINLCELGYLWSRWLSDWLLAWKPILYTGFLSCLLFSLSLWRGAAVSYRPRPRVSAENCFFLQIQHIHNTHRITFDSFCDFLQLWVFFLAMHC